MEFIPTAYSCPPGCQLSGSLRFSAAQAPPDAAAANGRSRQRNSEKYDSYLFRLAYRVSLPDQYWPVSQLLGVRLAGAPADDSRETARPLSLPNAPLRSASSGPGTPAATAVLGLCAAKIRGRRDRIGHKFVGAMSPHTSDGMFMIPWDIARKSDTWRWDDKIRSFHWSRRPKGVFYPSIQRGFYL